MLPDEIILPVLMRIQARLEDDLSLEAVSSMAGLSVFHFHRRFRAAVGETLKAYVLRLRLERAAFRLLLYDCPILDVALGCGFQNHETFTRAFRRRFSVSPAGYRKHHAGWLGEVRRRTADHTHNFQLSAIRIVNLRATHLASIRHVGPYEEVSDSLWARLDAWAKGRGLSGPRVWFGIGHDSPATTQSSRLRFDAGIRVNAPFAADGEVTHQVLPAATFAAITHIGAYATLPAAYAALFPQVMSMPKWQVIGLPAVEIYHATEVNAACALNHTEILIPVRDQTAPHAP